MTRQWSRRDVLQASAASGMFVGVQGWGGLSSMASAAPSVDSPKNEDDRIERLAERIMQTPPDRIVDVVMTELRNGLSRQQLLAANFNAGARFRNGHWPTSLIPSVLCQTKSLGNEPAAALLLSQHVAISSCPVPICRSSIQPRCRARTRQRVSFTMR